MQTAIFKSTDSQKIHRINLFSSTEHPDDSGTDRVIQAILGKY
jgi:hypothetical protein